MDGKTLKEYLTEYLNFTQEINSILSSKIDDYLDKIDMLISSRERIKCEIQKMNYTKEEFKSVVDELDLIKEDEKMCRLLNEHLKTTKGEIDANKKEMHNLSKQRMISNKYMNFNPMDPVFLSKKY